MKLHYTEVKNNVLEVKKDKRTEVYNWGEDNAFPSTLEYLINYSVTAKNAVDKSSKAISGKGVAKGTTIVNKKGHTLNDVIRALSREYVKHNNAFLSIGYNLLGEVSSIEVVPSKNVRIGKKDDSGYNGKYVVYNNWDKHDGKVNPESFQIIDRFNPNKEVVKSQIENAGGINKYKGQIIHIQKYLNEVYSLADATCVLTDMLAEINAAEFKQKGTTDGFINTKILGVKPFGSDEERRNFKNSLDSLRGAKAANSVIILEAPEASGELTEQFNLQDLTSTYDDKLFEYTEGSIEKSIAKAFNVPLALINPKDTGLFGNSGEMYKAVKQLLWEEREEERQKIEEALTTILSNWKDGNFGTIEIINHNDNGNNNTAGI